MPKKSNKSKLPEKLKEGIENLSGFSMDKMNVYYNSAEPQQIQAADFAQGNEIHLSSNQEKNLPHEAWHVVQQKKGKVKPAQQQKGKIKNDAKALEKEADAMAEKATVIKTTIPLNVVKH